MIIDAQLLMAAANLTANWKEQREDFAKFAKPYWEKWGGDGLVNHMMSKYVHNDEQSIVQYIYNLDSREKELVIRYLIKCSYPIRPQWLINVDEPKYFGGL